MPEGTLVARTLALLSDSPRSPQNIADTVLGLPAASPLIADRLVAALLGADPRVRRLPDGRWGLVSAAEGSPLIEDCAFAVVDVETTGGSPQGADRITEIAVVTLRGSRRETVFESLVNPGRSIPTQVASLTGISDSMVRNAPRFEDIAGQIMDALSGRVFVAHNARFDWGFIGTELRRARDRGLEGPMLCTVRLSRRLIPGIGSAALDSLIQYLGIENVARHRALGDAMATAELLERLLPIAREHGARTLDDLDRLQRKAA